MYANLRPLSKDLGKPLSFKASINKRAHPWYRYAHFQSKIHTSYSDWLNRRSPYRYPHSSALEFNPYQHLSWIETVEVPIKVRMIHLRTSAPSVGNSSSCFFFSTNLFHKHVHPLSTGIHNGSWSKEWNAATLTRARGRSASESTSNVRNRRSATVRSLEPQPRNVLASKVERVPQGPIPYEEIVSMMQEQAKHIRKLERNLQEVRGAANKWGH